MKKILFVILASLISACSISQSYPIVPVNPTSENWRCGLIQKNPEDLNISGRWQVEFNTSETDTLTINSDGTYKQLFVNSASNYRYETEANSWWLENVQGGGIYLHLDGMLYCGGFSQCVNPSNIELGFYDYCGDKWFNFDQEIILAVVGDTTAPNNIRLRNMRPAGCESCFDNYYFVEE
jgi:hypothetical protein